MCIAFVVLRKRILAWSVGGGSITDMDPVSIPAATSASLVQVVPPSTLSSMVLAPVFGLLSHATMLAPAVSDSQPLGEIT